MANFKFSHQISGFCSASFVGNKSFLTAGHCLGGVSRGLSDFKEGLIQEAPFFKCPGDVNIHYTVDSVADMKGALIDQDYDLGMVRVQESVTVPPIRLPSSSQESDRILKNVNSCFINGYGLDNQGKFGQLRAAQVVDMTTKPMIASLGTPPLIRIKKNTGHEGDSGGPLFCYDSEGPVLMGIIQGKMNKNSPVTYTDIHRVDPVTDWIQYHKNRRKASNEEFAKLNRIFDTCHSINRCFSKLETIAQLSVDLAKVFKVISQDAIKLRSKVLSGEEVLTSEIDQSWVDMLEIWKKSNCFDVLYPSPKP